MPSPLKSATATALPAPAVGISAGSAKRYSPKSGQDVEPVRTRVDRHQAGGPPVVNDPAATPAVAAGLATSEDPEPATTADGGSSAR